MAETDGAALQTPFPPPEGFDFPVGRTFISPDRITVLATVALAAGEVTVASFQVVGQAVGVAALAAGDVAGRAEKPADALMELRVTVTALAIPAPRFLLREGDVSPAGRVAATLTLAGFPDAQFRAAESSPGSPFEIDPDGRVSVGASPPPTGNHRLDALAHSPGGVSFLGTLAFGVDLVVQPDAGAQLQFGRTGINFIGDRAVVSPYRNPPELPGEFSTSGGCGCAPDDRTFEGQCRVLNVVSQIDCGRRDVEMVYHGRRRGLHVMVAEPFSFSSSSLDYHESACFEGSLENPGPKPADAGEFAANPYATPYQNVSNGFNWRRPTFNELAGLVHEGDSFVLDTFFTAPILDPEGPLPLHGVYDGDVPLFSGGGVDVGGALPFDSYVIPQDFLFRTLPVAPIAVDFTRHSGSALFPARNSGPELVCVVEAGDVSNYENHSLAVVRFRSDDPDSLTFGPEDSGVLYRATVEAFAVRRPFFEHTDYLADPASAAAAATVGLVTLFGSGVSVWVSPRSFEGALEVTPDPRGPGVAEAVVNIPQNVGGLVSVTIFAAATVGGTYIQTLLVRGPAEVPESDSVPSGRRATTRLAVADYTGPVAFFAAAKAGVTLRTPSAAPEGFDFPPDRDFVSPDGVTVLATVGLRPGGITVGIFEAVAKAAGFPDSALELRVTVSALALPPLPDLETQAVPHFNATVFDFADENYADGIYRNATFTEAEGDLASADLDVTGAGVVETAATLTLAGEYEITVLAESPDYAGTATLAAILTAHWRLEYEVDSGAGSLTALDADGNVLSSGGPIAPDAVATLTAEPSATHYVSAWSGDCENLGTVGVAEKPGDAQTCKLTAGKSLSVGVVFSPSPLPESFGVLERKATVYVAPNYAGSVAFFAAATTGVTLQTPLAAPESFGFPLESKFESPEGFEVSLTLAAGSGNVTVAAINATASFLDYAETEIPLQVKVSALVAPSPTVFTGVEGDAAVTTGATVAAFSLADYPDAKFYEVADADDLFEISAEGEVLVSVAGGLTAGAYNFTAAATSSLFLGAVEFPLRAVVLSGESEKFFILPDDREILRLAVADYIGSVAFFAAATVGATLRTPADAPEGFDFPTDRDFVSPDGITVLATVGLRPGGITVGIFEAVAKAAGFPDSALELRVTVSALVSPPLPALETQAVPHFSATVFDFADENYADGIYRNATFTEAEGDAASADLDVTGAGVVETAVTLTLAGEYEITVLAESPDYAGTATLAAILTAHWRLEYEVDSGAGSLTALDADGNVLSSGGPIAPDAVATLTAEPSATHYVSAWSGDCENLGTIGVADKPGEAQTCKLTAGKSLKVGAVFSPSPLPESLGVLERKATVYVAPNYTGSVAFFAAATVGVTLQTPLAAPESFGFPLESKFESPEGFAVSLTLAAGSGNVTIAAINATASFLDYAETEIPLQVKVSALVAPSPTVFTGVAGDALVTTGATVAAFSLADYPDAKFYEVTDADDLFEISAEGEVLVSVAGGLTAGAYNFTAAATSSLFLGEVEFPLRAVVLSGESEKFFILPDDRKVLRLAVADYVGSVAFFAAATVGATLRTPADAPEGFDFPTDRDFVSPDGVTVLATVGLSAGGMTVGAFEVVGKRDGFADAPLALRVTVSALVSPPLPALETQAVPHFSATVFDFADENYADGIYRNATFTEAEGDSASADLDVTGAGVVETATTLTLAGEYEITVLAESTDFAGTATLAAILTAHWKLEYEVDSGAGSLTALDADGNVLSSGGPIAPDAVATLTADPSDTHYVSAWSGDCENLGTVGVAEKPGEAQTCKLMAGKSLKVGAVFSPSPLPESFGVLERKATVYVAPNYTGSVAFFAAATTGVTLQTPLAAPESFGFPLESKFESPEGFEVSLTLAAGSGNVTVAAIDATASFLDYAETEISLQVKVSALVAPSPTVFTGVEGDAAVTTGATVAAFSLSDYPDAKFYEVADADDLFEISAEGEVLVSAPAGLTLGTYDFTAAATSALFLGAVEFPLRAVVGADSDPHFVPPDEREVLRLAAPGHVGSVAFFAAATEGATLRTPSVAPAGFGFPVGRDFVSPDGVVVRTTEGPPPGGVAVAEFQVVGRLAMFAEDALMTLRVTVSALAVAPPPDLGPRPVPHFSATIFNFADENYAGGIYRNATFAELGGAFASAELDVSENGVLKTAATLTLTGEYGITLLAESESDYAGAATLAALLTTQWKLEYAIDSGVGSLTARDAGGDEIPSGAAIAPGAVATLTARPAISHYVSAWSGDCETIGTTGDAENPGAAQTCPLRADGGLRAGVVFAQLPLPESYGVLNREAAALVAPGYAGAVALFAAATVGVTLQAPSAAPEPFGFGPDANFVSPEGLEVSLTLGLGPEEKVSAEFEVVASYLTYADITLTLRADAAALSSPAPAVLQRFADAPDFIGGLALTMLSSPAYPDSEFFEIADDSNVFEVEPSGMVRLSGAAPAGRHFLMVGATVASRAYRGALRFPLELRAIRDDVFFFGGYGAGGTLRAVADRATVRVFNYDIQRAEDAEMEFAGARGGNLLVMFNRARQDNGAAFRGGDRTGDRPPFFSDRTTSADLCAAGGPGWRFPKLSEAAGILAGPAASEILISPTADVPGGGADLTARFPADPDWSAAARLSGAGYSNVMTGLGLHPLLKVDGAGGTAALSDAGGLGGGFYLCALELLDYPAADYANLVGIRLESGGAEISAAAPLRARVSESAPGGLLTVTARAWRHGGFSPGFVFQAVAVDAPEEAILATLADPSDAALAELNVAQVGGPGALEVVLNLLAERSGISTVEIAFSPRLGAAVTLAVEVVSEPRPAADVLDRALPESARTFVINAPFNFSGEARTLSVQARSASLIITRQRVGSGSVDEIQIDSAGVLSVPSPVSRARQAVFGVTATVTAPENLVVGEPRSRALEVTVNLLPWDAVPLALLALPAGRDLSGVSLFAEEVVPAGELPALPLLLGADLRVPDGAELPDGFTATPEGDVRGPARLPPGEFDIPFAATGGDAFVGELRGVLRVVGNPQVEEGPLLFAGVDINYRGDLVVLENLQDASGNQFNAMYWGRRRGLHYMVARLGAPAGEAARLQRRRGCPGYGGCFSAPLNPDGTMRKNLNAEERARLREAVLADFAAATRRDDGRVTDARWSLADYAKFCGAGGDSGLGRIGESDWRPPTIGEAAALVHPPQDRRSDFLELSRRQTDIGVPGLLPSSTAPTRVPLPPGFFNNISDRYEEDSWGPIPYGLMAALNSGVPIVPGNSAGRAETPGLLWAAALGSNGEVGAFLPAEARTAAADRPYNSFLYGAAGFALCVAEDSDAYPPQPQLAVMEFSYDEKDVLCPLSAAPSAECNEAGHPLRWPLSDSAFHDESEFQAEVAQNAVGQARVFLTVTLRAFRFGGEDGAAATAALAGEANLARVENRNAAISIVKISGDENSAVFAVSLKAFAPAGLAYYDSVSARPRVGRRAGIRLSVRVVEPPPPSVGPEPHLSGSRIIYAGPGFSGAVLTVTSALADVTVGITGREANTLVAAKPGELELFGDPLPNGGRVVTLRLGANSQTPLSTIRLLISTSADAYASESALDVVAVHRAFAPQYAETGVPEAGALLTRLDPPPEGARYADPNPDDAFSIGADGRVFISERAAPPHPQREYSVPAGVVGPDYRGTFRLLVVAVNGRAGSRAPPPSSSSTDRIYPWVVRFDSDSPQSRPGTPVDRGRLSASHQIHGRRLVMAPGFSGVLATLTVANLPRGYASSFPAACALPRGVTLDLADGVLTADAAEMTADAALAHCPVEMTPAYGPYEPLSFVTEARRISLTHAGAKYEATVFVWRASDFYRERVWNMPPSRGGMILEISRIVQPREIPQTYAAVWAPADRSAPTPGDRFTDSGAVMGAAERRRVWSQLGEELHYDSDFSEDLDYRPPPRLAPTRRELHDYYFPSFRNEKCAGLEGNTRVLAVRHGGVSPNFGHTCYQGGGWKCFQNHGDYNPGLTIFDADNDDLPAGTPLCSAAFPPCLNDSGDGLHPTKNPFTSDCSAADYRAATAVPNLDAFNLLADGRVRMVPSRLTLNRTYTLAARATAPGMAGTLALSILFTPIPDRTYAARLPAGTAPVHGGTVLSIPIPNAEWDVEFGEAEMEALADQGFDFSVLPPDASRGLGRRLNFWISRQFPLGAFECRRLEVDATVWTDSSRTVPAEFWGASLSVEGAEISEDRPCGAFVRPVRVGFSHSPESGGTLTARNLDSGRELTPNEIVEDRTRLRFTAAPAGGYFVARWTGICAATPAGETTCDAEAIRTARAGVGSVAAGVEFAKARARVLGVENGNLFARPQAVESFALNPGDEFTLPAVRAVTVELGETVGAGGARASMRVDGRGILEMRGAAEIVFSDSGENLSVSFGGLALENNAPGALTLAAADGARVELQSGGNLTLRADGSAGIAAFALRAGRAGISGPTGAAPAELRCDDAAPRAGGGGYFTECFGDGAAVAPPAGGSGVVEAIYGPNGAHRLNLNPGDAAREIPLSAGATVRLVGGTSGATVLLVRADGARPAAILDLAADSSVALIPNPDAAADALPWRARILPGSAGGGGLETGGVRRELVNPDAAVPERDLEIPTAEGHSGFLRIVAVGAGYALENPDFDAAAFSFDPATGALGLAAPLAAGPAPAAVIRADVACVAAACVPLKITVTARVVAVSPPAQATLRAVRGDAFAHTLALPPEYAGAFAAVAGVGGDENGFFELNERNEIVPPADPAHLLSGNYVVAVDAEHAGFAGTLKLQVTAEIAACQDGEFAFGFRGDKRCVAATGDLPNDAATCEGFNGTVNGARCEIATQVYCKLDATGSAAVAFCGTGAFLAMRRCLAKESATLAARDGELYLSQYFLGFTFEAALNQVGGAVLDSLCRKCPSDQRSFGASCAAPAAVSCDPATERRQGNSCVAIADPDAVVAAREVAVFAAAGFTGAAHTVTVAENFTLSFSARDNRAGFVGFALNAVASDDWEIEITTALDSVLRASAVARILRAGHAADPLSITAVFTPVLSPAQTILRAPRNAFTHTLALPPDFSQGVAVTILGINGDPSGRAFEASADNELIPPADWATLLPEGGYTVTVGVSHPGFRGILALEVTAEIGASQVVCADGEKERRGVCETVADPDDVVAIRLAEVLVAEGFTGAAHTVTVSENFALSLAAEDNPSGFAGFTLNAIADDDWEIEITTGIGSVLRASVVARISRADYYPDALSITTTFTPVLSPAQTILRAPRNAFTHTLALPPDFSQGVVVTILGINGDPSGRAFEASADNELIPPADWATLLPEGGYTVTVGVSHPGFRGILALEVTAEIGASQVVCADGEKERRGVCETVADPDDVVAIRLAEVLVAEGFTGAAHTVTVSENFALSIAAEDNPSGFAGFTLNAIADDDWEIEITEPLQTNLRASVVARIVRADYYPDALSITTTFTPVLSPAQTILRAPRNAFTHTLALPPDFSQGVAVTILGVNGDPSGRAFELNDDDEIVPPTDWANLLAAGDYTVTVGVSHSGFLGTLKLQVTAEIGEAELNCNADQRQRGVACETVADPDEVVAIRLAEVLVAEGFTGAAHTVTVSENFALSLAAEDNPSGFAGFTLNAIADDDWEIEITEPLQTNLRASVVARIVRADYYPDALSITTTFTPVLSPAQTILRAPRNAFTHTLALPPDFSQGVAVTILGVNGDPSGRAFELNDDDEIVPPTDWANLLAAGDYTVTVGVSHSGFLGTLKLQVTAEIGEAELNCNADQRQRGVACETVADPDEVVAVRLATVFVAQEFAGAAHTVTVAENFTLSFEAGDNPSGFAGFALNTVAGGDWEIEITEPLQTTLRASVVARIRRAGYYPETLSITTTFAPVLAPAQATLRASRNDDFAHAPALPAGFAADRFSATITGVDGDPDGRAFGLNSQSQIVPPSDRARLRSGGYTVRVAVRHPGFVGPLRLEIPAEIADCDDDEIAFGYPGRRRCVAAAGDLPGSVETCQLFDGVATESFVRTECFFQSEGDGSACRFGDDRDSCQTPFSHIRACLAQEGQFYLADIEGVDFPEGTCAACPSGEVSFGASCEAAATRESASRVAADGYEGEVYMVQAELPAGFRPALSDSGYLRLDADGAVRTTRPLDRLVDDEIRVRLLSAAPDLAVSLRVAALRRVDYELERSAGSAFAPVDLAVGALAGASFSPPAGGSFPAGGYGVSPAGELTRSGGGVVESGEALAAFSVSGGNVVGTVSGRIFIRGNPAAPADLSFGATVLTRRGQVFGIENADAAGRNLRAVYWGRRRGLHYVLVKTGDIPPPPGGASAALDLFGGEVGGGYYQRDAAGDLHYRPFRESASARGVSPGWTMADYAQLCGGRANGGGGFWRAPALGEAAALVYGGDGRRLTLTHRTTDIGVLDIADFGGDGELGSPRAQSAWDSRGHNINIPGLVPTRRLSARDANGDRGWVWENRVSVAAAEGGDWRALPFGAAVAAANGVPAGYLPEHPSGWTAGRMWAVGLGVWGEEGIFGAFTPESGFGLAGRRRLVDKRHGLDGLGRVERQYSEGLLLDGATGYAACVSPADDSSYENPPELSVLELDYAGKAIKCPLDASPSAGCGRPVDPETGLRDSALSDASLARLPGRTRPDAVIATLTVRAWRFGKRSDGAPELEAVSGEAGRARMRVSEGVVGTVVAATGATLIRASADATMAVYLLSLGGPGAAAHPEDYKVRILARARPRLGEPAAVVFEAVISTLESEPPPPPPPPLSVSEIHPIQQSVSLPPKTAGLEVLADGGEHLTDEGGLATVTYVLSFGDADRGNFITRRLQVGTGFTGGILTVTSLAAGVNLQVREIDSGAGVVGLDAAVLPDGGRVARLESPLPHPRLVRTFEDGKWLRHFVSSPGDEAAITLGVRVGGGAEVTVALVAHPLALPALRLSLTRLRPRVGTLGPGGATLTLSLYSDPPGPDDGPERDLTRLRTDYDEGPGVWSDADSSDALRFLPDGRVAAARVLHFDRIHRGVGILNTPTKRNVLLTMEVLILDSGTQLVSAIAAGDEAAVRNLRADFARYAGPDGDYPLHLALRAEPINPAIVSLLLEAAPEVLRLPGADGDAPLVVAVARGGPAGAGIIDLLADADPGILNLTLASGDYPLHAALRREPIDAAAVGALLRRAPEVARLPGANGDEPLQVALRSPSVDAGVVGLLKDAAPEILDRRPDGDYPLHAVLRRRPINPAGVSVLAELDAAALDARDAAGWAPLHILATAVRPLDSQMAQARARLAEMGLATDGTLSFHPGALAAAEILLDAGADANATIRHAGQDADLGADNALGLAFRLGLYGSTGSPCGESWIGVVNLELLGMVKLLRDRGADPNLLHRPPPNHNQGHNWSVLHVGIEYFQKGMFSVVEEYLRDGPGRLAVEVLNVGKGDASSASARTSGDSPLDVLDFFHNQPGFGKNCSSALLGRDAKMRALGQLMRDLDLGDPPGAKCNNRTGAICSLQRASP